jgi:hypothetical protein
MSVHVAGKTGFYTAYTFLSKTIGLGVRGASDPVVNEALNQQVRKCSLEFSSSIGYDLCTSPITTNDSMQEVICYFF